MLASFPVHVWDTLRLSLSSVWGICENNKTGDLPVNHGWMHNVWDDEIAVAPVNKREGKKGLTSTKSNIFFNTITLTYQKGTQFFLQKYDKGVETQEHGPAMIMSLSQTEN